MIPDEIPASPGNVRWLLFKLDTGEIVMQGSALGEDTARLQKREGTGLLLANGRWDRDFVDLATGQITERPSLPLVTDHTIAVGEELALQDLPIGTLWLRGFEDEVVIDDGELVVAYESPGPRSIALRPPFPLLPIDIRVTVE